MISFLAWTLIIAAAAIAVYGIVLTALDRVPGRVMQLAVWVLEAALLVQVVIAAFRVFAGAKVSEPLTFAGYLVAAIIVLPLAVQWTRAEPSRWNGAVVAVGAIAVGIAVARLQAIWSASGVG